MLYRLARLVPNNLPDVGVSAVWKVVHVLQ